MVVIEKLKVSLTKNGYLKTWRLVRLHPSDKILANVTGKHPGINLAPSQVRNILSADASGTIPAFWDDIRKYNDQTIKAFTFLAIVLSHHRLIEALQHAGKGTPKGRISRDEMSEKEYTNLVYSLSELGYCHYERGAASVSYDISPLAAQLQPARKLVEQLVSSKLRRCGWRDPNEFTGSTDQPLVSECRKLKLHEALGMGFGDFSRWLTGTPSRPR
jgi:hypothetical protein